MISNEGSKHLSDLTKVKISVTPEYLPAFNEQRRISNKQDWRWGNASDALSPGMKFKGASKTSVIKTNDIVIQSLKNKS